MPYLYPNLMHDNSEYITEDDLEDYVLKDELPDEPLLLQTKTEEFNSTDWIWDDDTTPALMKDTKLNITTRGNSRLVVAFDAQITLLLINGFDGIASYNITLQVEGIKQETVRIISYHGEPIVGQKEMFIYLQISFETRVLPESTYQIFINWNSIIDTSFTSRLSIGVYSYNNFIRSLSVQEFRA